MFVLRSLLWSLCLALGALGGPASTWNVLVLGGTGFRGHPTTDLLIREGHNVTVLSRGRSYWGYLGDIKGRAAHWKCNRTLALAYGGAPLSESSGLVNCTELTSSSTSFDAVVDFSSRSSDELKQALKLLRGRVGVYIFMSSHAVYEVSMNSPNKESWSLETDARRPGREVSPLERYELKGKSQRGDAMLECEEALAKQFNAGGFPYVALRLANIIGPKENTVRYWLLHLWVRAHVALTMPMHLDDTMFETPISLTFTPDVAQAVVRAIAMSKDELCCAEDVVGQAFNLACEEAPNQRNFYNHVAEPIYVPYVETVEVSHNKSIVLYPEIVRAPLDISKAIETLRWSPTTLSKAIRSVARFYDRVMLSDNKHKHERDLMYRKTQKMLGADGPKFVSWLKNYYDERRKTELYDELDDEDEDEILLSRPDPERLKRRRRRRKSRKGPRQGGEL